MVAQAEDGKLAPKLMSFDLFGTLIFFAAHQIAVIDLTNAQAVGDVSEQVSAMSPG